MMRKYLLVILIALPVLLGIDYGPGGSGGGGGGGSGATTDGGVNTYVTSQTDNFVVGGTTCANGAVCVEESTGDITSLVPGGTVTTTAHPTDGSSISVSEGADDGEDEFAIKVPDSGLNADKTCLLDADGRLPNDCVIPTPAQYIDIDLGAAANPCVAFADGIKGIMDDSPARTNAVVRVHHDGVAQVTINIEDDYYAPAYPSGVLAGTVPYQMCFPMHPTTDSTQPYPAPYSPTALQATMFGNNSVVHVIWDEVNILLGQTGITRPSCLVDIGNGYGAGKSFGRVGQGLKMSGAVNVTYSGSGDADRATLQWARVSSGTPYDTRPPAGAVSKGSSRFNYDDTSVAFCANGMTRTDARDMVVHVGAQDSTDIICSFSQVWSSNLPTCESQGFNNGVGYLFPGGSINADIKNTNMRSIDYPVILGSLSSKGEYDSSIICAEDTSGVGTDCADTGRAARGLTFQGGVIEAGRYANILAYSYETRNVFRDVHLEQGVEPTMGSIIVSPHTCVGNPVDNQGQLFGTAVNPMFAAGNPRVDCLERFLITQLTDGASSCTIELDVDIDTAGSSGPDIDVGDDLIVRGVDDDALAVATIETAHDITAVDAAANTVTVGVDCTTTALTIADDAYVQVVDGGDGAGGGFVGETEDVVLPNDDRGHLVFHTRMTGAGGGVSGISKYDDEGSPAVVIGNNLVAGNTVVFGSRTLLSGGTGLWNGSTFAFQDELLKETRPSWTASNSVAGLVGRVDTTGAMLYGSSAQFPLEFEGWYDAREESLYRFLHGNSDAPDVRSDADRATSNECLLHDKWVREGVEFTASDDTSCGASAYRAFQLEQTPIYLSRANWTVFGGYTGSESCAVGIALSAAIDGSNTYDAILEMPPVDGLSYAAGDFEVYGLGIFYNEDREGIALNNPVFPFFRGQFSSAGSGEACTTSAFGVIDIRGFRFNPRI